jgi:hypothetical protein
MHYKITFMAGLLATLVGCVTTATHSVSVDDIRALRLERVDLVIDPAATVAWPYLQDEYAESRKRQGDTQATEQSVRETPGFRAHVASRLLGTARGAIDPPLREALGGSRPVVARITVHHLKIIGLAEGMVTAVFAGAAAATSHITVSIDFVDARTNRLIVAYPKSGISTQGGHRLDIGATGHFAADPTERLFRDLATRVPSWLLKA